MLGIRPQFILNVEQTRQVDGTVPMTSAIGDLKVLLSNTIKGDKNDAAFTFMHFVTARWLLSYE